MAAYIILDPNTRFTALYSSCKEKHKPAVKAYETAYKTMEAVLNVFNQEAPIGDLAFHYFQIYKAKEELLDSYLNPNFAKLKTLDDLSIYSAITSKAEAQMQRINQKITAPR